MKPLLAGKPSWPLLGVLVAALVLVIVGTMRPGQTSSAPPPSDSTATTRSGEVPILGWLAGRGDEGTREPGAPPVCSAGAVPDGVRTSVALVRSRGPFPVPERDGGTYLNRGGLLPAKQNGYYREYTAPGPGGAQAGRLVTGGVPSNNPQHWYYSPDGYRTICEITEVP